MDQRQESAVRALLKHDVASSNIELVEYLVTELKLPAAQAWTAVRQRHTMSHRSNIRNTRSSEPMCSSEPMYSNENTSNSEQIIELARAS